MKLKNKIALITGAGRGIGRSIALAFAAEGADVVLAARSRDQLEKVAQEVQNGGQRALTVPCNVTQSTDTENLAQVVRKEFGRMDILVNNAGISKRSDFLAYDDETWFEVIRVNLYGVYLCTKALLPLIQKSKKGRIIMMASTAAKDPIPFNTAYSTSKHGLLGLTKSLASELALTGYPGITVNAICPYFVKTDMLYGPEGYIAQMMKNRNLTKQEVMELVEGHNLQQRVLEPEEIASMAVHLATDGAAGITGQAINVCGGKAFH